MRLRAAAVALLNDPRDGDPLTRHKPVGERNSASHPHLAGIDAAVDAELPFPAQIVEATNFARERVGLPMYDRSSALEQIARWRLDELAADGACFIAHDGGIFWDGAGTWESGNGPGHSVPRVRDNYVSENLYKVVGMQPGALDVVDAWYREVDWYRYGAVGSSCVNPSCPASLAVGSHLAGSVRQSVAGGEAFTGTATTSQERGACPVGHFTSLLYAVTAQMGCERRQCSDADSEREGGESWLVVCAFWQGTNVVGELPFPPSVGSKLGVGSTACSP